MLVWSTFCGTKWNTAGRAVSSPRLVADVVRQGLFTHVVGRRIVYHPVLSSTMDEAARLAEQGADEGTVVIAERQSAGRGRQGRSWVSQPGNLLFSIVFRPDIARLPFISIIGGVASARAVRKTTGLVPTIKWPNDLMLSGKKAAGILAESTVVGETVCYAVLGIGINVSLNPSEMEEISAFATSVNAAAGLEVDRVELLRQLLLELDDTYMELGNGVSPIPEWTGLLDSLGTRVEVVSGGKVYPGVAESVDDTGNLLLRVDSGELLTMTAGDVTLGSTNQG